MLSNLFIALFIELAFFQKSRRSADQNCRQTAYTFYSSDISSVVISESVFSVT